MTDAMYEQCPKCLHAPLPRDQALPAACPACGIILAKFSAAALPDTESVSKPVAEVGAVEGLAQRFKEAIVHLPAQVEPATLWGRAALLLLFAVWGLRLICLDHRTGQLGESFLHGPLLIFHEAGHVIFSFFGEFITILGGTLTQLLMPAIMAGALLFRNRDPYGAAIATWFLGVSLLDVAPYIYDALDPQLVLLGGHTGKEGGHDWVYLLNESGLLQQAHGLGWMVHKIGAAVVLLSIGWAGWFLMRLRRVMLAE